MNEHTYIIYLRAPVYTLPPLVHARSTAWTTIDDAMSFIESQFGNDGLARTPLELFTGTKDACRERMAMYAALNDAQVVRDIE